MLLLQNLFLPTSRPKNLTHSMLRYSAVSVTTYRSSFKGSKWILNCGVESWKDRFCFHWKYTSNMYVVQHNMNESFTLG